MLALVLLASLLVLGPGHVSAQYRPRQIRIIPQRVAQNGPQMSMGRRPVRQLSQMTPTQMTPNQQARQQRVRMMNPLSQIAPTSARNLQARTRLMQQRGGILQVRGGSARGPVRQRVKQSPLQQQTAVLQQQQQRLMGQRLNSTPTQRVLFNQQQIQKQNLVRLNQRVQNAQRPSNQQKLQNAQQTVNRQAQNQNLVQLNQQRVQQTVNQQVQNQKRVQLNQQAQNTQRAVNQLQGLNREQKLFLQRNLPNTITPQGSQSPQNLQMRYKSNPSKYSNRKSIQRLPQSGPKTDKKLVIIDHSHQNSPVPTPGNFRYAHQNMKSQQTATSPGDQYTRNMGSNNAHPAHMSQRAQRQEVSVSRQEPTIQNIQSLTNANTVNGVEQLQTAHSSQNGHLHSKEPRQNVARVLVAQDPQYADSGPTEVLVHVPHKSKYFGSVSTATNSQPSEYQHKSTGPTMIGASSQQTMTVNQFDSPSSHLHSQSATRNLQHNPTHSQTSGGSSANGQQPQSSSVQMHNQQSQSIANSNTYYPDNIANEPIPHGHHSRGSSRVNTQSHQGSQYQTGTGHHQGQSHQIESLGGNTAPMQNINHPGAVPNSAGHPTQTGGTGATPIGNSNTYNSNTNANNPVQPVGHAQQSISTVPHASGHQQESSPGPAQSQSVVQGHSPSSSQSHNPSHSMAQKYIPTTQIPSLADYMGHSPASSTSMSQSPSAPHPRVQDQGLASPNSMGQDPSSPDFIGHGPTSPHSSGQGPSPHSQEFMGQSPSSPHAIGHGTASPHSVGQGPISPHSMGYDPISPHVMEQGPSSPDLMGHSPASAQSMRHNPASPDFIGQGPASPHSIGQGPASPDFMGQDPASPHVMGSPHSIGQGPASPDFMGHGPALPNVMGYDPTSVHSMGHGPSSQDVMGQGPSPHSMGQGHAPGYHPMSGHHHHGHMPGQFGPYGINPFSPPAPIGSPGFIAWLHKLDQLGIDTPYEMPDSTDPPTPPPPTSTPVPPPPPTLPPLPPQSPPIPVISNADLSALNTATSGNAAVTGTKPTSIAVDVASPSVLHSGMSQVSHSPVPLTASDPLGLGHQNYALETALNEIISILRAQQIVPTSPPTVPPTTRATTTTTTTTSTTTAIPIAVSLLDRLPASTKPLLASLGLTPEKVRTMTPVHPLFNTLEALVSVFAPDMLYPTTPPPSIKSTAPPAIIHPIPTRVPVVTVQDLHVANTFDMIPSDALAPPGALATETMPTVIIQPQPELMVPTISDGGLTNTHLPNIVSLDSQIPHIVDTLAVEQLTPVDTLVASPAHYVHSSGNVANHQYLEAIGLDSSGELFAPVDIAVPSMDIQVPISSTVNNAAYDSLVPLGGAQEQTPAGKTAPLDVNTGPQQGVTVDAVPKTGSEMNGYLMQAIEQAVTNNQNSGMTESQLLAEAYNAALGNVAIIDQVQTEPQAVQPMDISAYPVVPHRSDPFNGAPETTSTSQHPMSVSQQNSGLNHHDHHPAMIQSQPGTTPPEPPHSPSSLNHPYAGVTSPASLTQPDAGVASPALHQFNERPRLSTSARLPADFQRTHQINHFPHGVGSSTGTDPQNIPAAPSHSAATESALRVESAPIVSAHYVNSAPAVSAHYVDSAPAVSATYVDSAHAVPAHYVDLTPAVSAHYVDTAPAVSALNVESAPSVSAHYVDTAPAVSALNVESAPPTSAAQGHHVDAAPTAKPSPASHLNTPHDPIAHSQVSNSVHAHSAWSTKANNPVKAINIGNHNTMPSHTQEVPQATPGVHQQDVSYLNTNVIDPAYVQEILPGQQVSHLDQPHVDTSGYPKTATATNMHDQQYSGSNIMADYHSPLTKTTKDHSVEYAAPEQWRPQANIPTDIVHQNHLYAQDTSHVEQHPNTINAHGHETQNGHGALFTKSEIVPSGGVPAPSITHGTESHVQFAGQNYQPDLVGVRPANPSSPVEVHQITPTSPGVMGSAVSTPSPNMAGITQAPKRKKKKERQAGGINTQSAVYTHLVETIKRLASLRKPAFISKPLGNPGKVHQGKRKKVHVGFPIPSSTPVATPSTPSSTPATTIAIEEEGTTTPEPEAESNGNEISNSETRNGKSEKGNRKSKKGIVSKVEQETLGFYDRLLEIFNYISSKKAGREKVVISSEAVDIAATSTTTPAPEEEAEEEEEEEEEGEND